MMTPTRDEVLFSLKSYVGAMLALYLSYRIGLSRPFWAVTTAYVVSQPWSGAVRSKAVYRLCGTFVGSAVCVFLVPRLANAPVLMTLAMMLWIGLCVYISVLDRTPRSYLFMLAGYTAAMVAFPSVTAPETVFDTALSRVEEISLGILCATLIHSLILPRGMSSVMLAGLDRAVADGRRWMSDVLGRAAEPARRREQLRLANDITQLRILSTHIPFDTSNIRFATYAVRAMQDALAALTPVIAAIEDRLAALTEDGSPLPAPWQDVLSQTEAWLEASQSQPDLTPDTVLATIDHVTPAMRAGASWRDALELSLALRLKELIVLYGEALKLREEVARGLAGTASTRLRTHAVPDVLHRDHGVALLSGLAAMIAVALCSIFWIATAWPNGAVAVLMAAVFSSFFASQDNPLPGIMMFLKFTLLSMPLSAIYLLGVMPAVHSFEILALTIAPVALVLGVLIARPATMGKGMALFFGFAGTLALHDTQTADIVTFLDTNLAQVVGVATAAIVTALLRKISVEASARRIQAAGWRELAQIATARRAPNVYLFNARRLDRVGLLQARLGASEQADTVARDALLDLRVGRDMADVLNTRDALLHAALPLRALLADLAKLFRGRARRQQASESGFQAGESTLTRIDAALAAVVDGSDDDVPSRRTVVALVGLRRALFPLAPPPDMRAWQTPVSPPQTPAQTHHRSRAQSASEPGRPPRTEPQP